jgi:phosphate transport system substrate-binding protein
MRKNEIKKMDYMEDIMKKIGAVFLAFALAACGETGAFDAGRDISVVSREEGSGTRGAFIELLGILETGADGTKRDRTTKEAVIAKQTDVMMTNIAGDKYAIGYISLGSLNSSVKALNIDGAAASRENVQNGSYKISRSFYIAVKGEISALAQDFTDFILSSEGQATIGASYIPILENATPFAGGAPSGKLVVAGSSSVVPVMEKLKEAYLEINSGASIEIQQTDSSAGMIAAMEGTCDIGMASRELKESELASLTPIQIALDGIAIIVNNNNPESDLTKDQIKSIFTGETLKWSDAE